MQYAHPQRASMRHLTRVICGLSRHLFHGFKAYRARFVNGLLYGVKPVDQQIFAGATFILSLVGAFAGFLPALRASRIDPVVSLRYE